MDINQFMEKALERFEKEFTDRFFLFIEKDKELMKDYLDTVAETKDLQTVNSQISKLLADHFKLEGTGVINDNPQSNLIQSYSERRQKKD